MIWYWTMPWEAELQGWLASTQDGDLLVWSVTCRTLQQQQHALEKQNRAFDTVNQFNWKRDVEVGRIMSIYKKEANEL